MPSVTYGAGAYKRDTGNFPPLTLINMFVEQAKTSENSIALQSRPGLGVLATNGAGPINGMFSKKGTLSGDVFSLSGTTLYRGTTSLGAVASVGTGAASFAGSATELVVTRGGTAYSYNGTNIAAITFPDTANVTAVRYIGGLFVFLRASSHKFYWSAINDGRTIDALSFESDEREPDTLLDAYPLGDNLWTFGQQSISCFNHNGADPDLPFTRIEQVAYDKGIMATGCVAAADNSLIFVGSNRSVYRIGEVPVRISDHSIEERILASTDARVFPFQWEGHEFVAIRLDTETLIYDCTTSEWCEFRSSGGQWIVAHAAMQDKVAYFGHQTTGQLMGWDEWDDLGEELTRMFTAAVPLDQPVSFDRVHLWANTGQTPLLTGQGSDPVIEISMSDDAGNTWDDWESTELGVQGAYRTIAEWRALGMFDFPGAMMRFRVTDPVPLRVSAVKLNDQGGGRAV